MTALLFLVGAALLGAGLVRRALGRLLGGAEQVLWGLVVGWMLATLAAYAVARTFGRLEFWPLAALTAALWAAAAALWLLELKRRRERGFERRGWRLREHAGLAFVLALFAPVYCCLFATRMLEEGAGGVYSGGSTWYDLGFHLAISTSFLHGQNFPPIYTPLAPAPLLYPFLPDFLTAVVAALGLGLRASLCWTGVPLALATTGIFYSFARRVAGQLFEGTQTQEGADGVRAQAPDETLAAGRAVGGVRAQASAALATLLFLLNGGLGFLYFFADWRASGESLAGFWSRLDVNYANMPARQIQWTNLVTDTLLPQRTSLFGIPVALAAFTLFAVAWGVWSRDGKEGEGRWSGWRVLFAAGVLAGLLPLFHTHSYVAVGLVSGFLFLLRPRRAWLAFWLPAVLLALPHFLSLAGHVAAADSFMRFQPGWRGHNEANWPLYWLKNLGVPLLLIVPAWLVARREWRRFYLAFLCLMAVSVTVVFTPNDYDNIKLMFYWHAATCVLVAAWLVRLATARRLRLLALPLALLLALASVASGLLALRFEGLSRKLLFNGDELAAAAFAREATAPHALFLTAPTVHQPVLSLAGRAVLRGDTAWLWSHGYEFREREADVRRIYAGAGDALELLRYYRVDYVYLGERERKSLRANQSFFDEHFKAVHRSGPVTIYDTRATSNAPEPSDAPAPYPPREFASRLAVDPAQFLSEFPRAAFAVYRLHKVAYGRAPVYAEFVPDLEAVGRGVYVGAPGWRELLEENLRRLADALAARDEFRALHDGETDAQFVDALHRNAGITPDESVSLALINLLGEGETRAHALRRVADDGRLRRRDFNTAFVLMHYFGYLRRNPADAPDRDLSGFNFWLEDLDRTGDYRSLTRVFLESGEYKDRR